MTDAPPARTRPPASPAATTAAALLPAPRVRSIRRRVLEWGAEHFRDLPWRATRDPWHVLVSEVMLQQTQAHRVVEPYLRFVRRFPTPVSCARAGQSAVVREWAGLGYNRRARYLHALAGVAVERHRGAIPSEMSDLIALPGIGPYTARAVRCFAFGHDVGVVETNVARVLARAVAGRRLTMAESQALADRLAGGGGAWAFNQAVIDLGALRCTSRGPICATCPLRRHCRWRVGDVPVGSVPDPVVGTAGTARPQAPFNGSDRQARGRLLGALRSSPVPSAGLASAAGREADPAAARRAAAGLVADGLARWAEDRLELA